MTSPTESPINLPSSGPQQPDPEWGAAARDVSRWPPLLALLVAIGLYVTLPDRFYYGGRWVLPAIEGAMFVSLLAAKQMEGHRWQRWSMIGLIAIINAANIGSLLLLLHSLVTSGSFHGKAISAQDLLISAAAIWLTNVIVFGLWYWELDRGGPVERCSTRHREPDFLFPQMANPHATARSWTPSFLDYLYVSFTNATAFSPTDTMPLTEWAKVLMAVQSMASLLTIGLVAARAVNILK